MDLLGGALGYFLGRNRDSLRLILVAALSGGVATTVKETEVPDRYTGAQAAQKEIRLQSQIDDLVERVESIEAHERWLKKLDDNVLTMRSKVNEISWYVESYKRNIQQAESWKDRIRDVEVMCESCMREFKTR